VRFGARSTFELNPNPKQQAMAVVWEWAAYLQVTFSKVGWPRPDYYGCCKLSSNGDNTGHTRD